MAADPIDPELAKLLEEQRRTIEKLHSELAAKDAREKALEQRIRALLQQLYGVKSEKLDPRQYQLVMEGLNPQAAPVAVVEAEAEAAKEKKRGGGRRPMPKELPVKVTIIDVPEAERKGMVKIREEVTEQLERAPARHYVHRIIRYVYADPAKEEAPKVAALPAQVYPQSGLGTSVIANAAVAKFCDHVPLFRQERIALREGVDLPRQKLGRGLEAGAQLLGGIESALWQRLLDSQYLQVDETEYKLIDPLHKGKTVRGRFWVFHSPKAKAVIASFERSKDHEILLHRFPPEWKGTVQSDAAKQYDAFGAKRPKVRQAGCMAHARRKWFDAARGGGDQVAAILVGFGRLYRVEREARQLSLQGDERAIFRQSRRVPELLQELKGLIEAARGQPGVLPDDLVGRASAYALNNWPRLSLYAEAGFGHVEIDNNLCENSIRPIVLTRKNALFIGHPDAAWVSNVYMSVIGTCRLLGVDPEAYLNWVLPQLAAGTNRSTASGLLPHDYAKLPVKEPQP